MVPAVTGIPFAGLLAVTLLTVAPKPVATRTPEQVQALVDQAAEHIRNVGRQQAFADFNRRDGGFVDGELYIFCGDATGKVLAHGDNPKLVGKSVANVRDTDGKSPAVEVFRVAQTKGKGWVEY